jgi:hypothetical protein
MESHCDGNLAMTRSLVLLGGLLISFFPKTAVAQSCPNNAAQEEAKKVRAIRADLLAIQVRNNDRGTGIPTTTQRAIREFKNEIATTITYYLSCAPKEHLETKTVEGDLARLLDANEAASTEQTSARGKPDTKAKHFQVQMNSDPGSPMYFQIKQGENSFMMLATSLDPDSQCKGPDLMSKRY